MNVNATRAGTKRSHGDLLDATTERAKKAEHDRAMAYKETTLLIGKHRKDITATEVKLGQLQAELAAATLTLVQNRGDVTVLKRKLGEAETALEKLKKPEAMEAMEVKWTAAQLVIKDLKAKLKEITVDCEEIAARKQEVDVAEVERERDPEYAELKKALESAKWRHGVDEELSIKAYRQIFALKREVASAKEKLTAARKTLGEDVGTEETKDDAS